MTQASEDLSALDLTLLHRRQGFSTIAVHFVIKRDGTTEEGRALYYPGAAAPRNKNATCIQVCLIGGLGESLDPEDNFTDEQHQALAALATRLGLPLEVDPTNPIT